MVGGGCQRSASESVPPRLRQRASSACVASGSAPCREGQNLSTSARLPVRGTPSGACATSSRTSLDLQQQQQAVPEPVTLAAMVAGPRGDNSALAATDSCRCGGDTSKLQQVVHEPVSVLPAWPAKDTRSVHVVAPEDVRGGPLSPTDSLDVTARRVPHHPHVERKRSEGISPSPMRQIFNGHGVSPLIRDGSMDSMPTTLHLSAATEVGRTLGNAGIYRELDSLRALASRHSERLDRLAREVALLSARSGGTPKATSVTIPKAGGIDAQVQPLNTTGSLNSMDRDGSPYSAKWTAAAATAEAALYSSSSPGRAAIEAMDAKLEARLAAIEAEAEASRIVLRRTAEECQAVALRMSERCSDENGAEGGGGGATALRALEAHLTEVLNELGVKYEAGHSALVTRLAEQQVLVDRHQASIRELSGSLGGVARVDSALGLSESCRTAPAVGEEGNAIDGAVTAAAAASAAAAAATAEAQRSTLEALETRLTQVLVELGQEHQRAVKDMLGELEAVRGENQSLCSRADEQSIAVESLLKALATLEASVEADVKRCRKASDRVAAELETEVGHRSAAQKEVAAKMDKLGRTQDDLRALVVAHAEVLADMDAAGSPSTSKSAHAEAAKAKSASEAAAAAADSLQEVRAEILEATAASASSMVASRIAELRSEVESRLRVWQSDMQAGLVDAATAEAGNLVSNSLGALQSALMKAAVEEASAAVSDDLTALRDGLRADLVDAATSEAARITADSLDQLQVELVKAATAEASSVVADSFSELRDSSATEAARCRREVAEAVGAAARSAEAATAAADAVGTVSALRSELAQIAAKEAAAVSERNLTEVRAQLAQDVTEASSASAEVAAKAAVAAVGDFSAMRDQVVEIAGNESIAACERGLSALRDSLLDECVEVARKASLEVAEPPADLVDVAKAAAEEAAAATEAAQAASNAASSLAELQGELLEAAASKAASHAVGGLAELRAELVALAAAEASASTANSLTQFREELMAECANAVQQMSSVGARQHVERFVGIDRDMEEIRAVLLESVRSNEERQRTFGDMLASLTSVLPGMRMPSPSAAGASSAGFGSGIVAGRLPPRETVAHSQEFTRSLTPPRLEEPVTSMPPQPPQGTEKVKSPSDVMFDLLDRNGDGSITKEEWDRAMGLPGAEQVPQGYWRS